MGKFAGKTTILLLTIFLLNFVYIEFYCDFFSNKEYPFWKHQYEVVTGQKKVPRGPKIVILGDSRAMAGLDPRNISDQTLSICIPGATAIEAYYSLKRYLKVHKKPDVMILSFSPAHFENYDCMFYQIKYKTITLREQIEIMRKGEELGAYLPQPGSYSVNRIKGMDLLSVGPFIDHVVDSMPDNYKNILDNLAVRLNMPYIYQMDIQNSLNFSKKMKNRRSYAMLDQTRGQFTFPTGKVTLNDEAKSKDFKPNPLIEHYMLLLLDLCKRNGIKVYYKNMPMTALSCKSLTPGYKSHYEEYFRYVADAHPEAILDYKIVEFDNKLFGDESHLNRKGMKLITEDLRESLKKSGLLRAGEREGLKRRNY